MFDVFNAALQEQVPELVSKWKEWVTAWESKQHTTSMESPFEVKEKGMSMKEIRLKLAKEELLQSGEGIEVEREDTPSTFIMMGLEIEESQRYLAIDVKAISNPTPTQELNFMKHRGTIVKRIRVFRKLQRAYMPHVRRFLTQSQWVLWDTEANRDAEAIQLFMLSDIADASRRVKRALTWGQGVLRQNKVHIHKGKLCYRYARNAVSQLRGNGEWERTLQVLLDSDIRTLNERALTNEELAQREVVHDLFDVEEGGIAVVKAGELSKQELVEALRVEWCKVYARTRRWIEDTMLVEEEMRRTIEYDLEQASAHTGVSNELAEGLNAYAKEQADREARTCEKLRRSWAQVREDGRAFLGREATASIRMVLWEWNRHEEGGDDEGEDDKEERPDYEDDLLEWYGRQCQQQRARGCAESMDSAASSEGARAPKRGNERVPQTPQIQDGVVRKVYKHERRSGLS
ncbi:hypothetical protein B0H17DRAFT_1148218 [Mycena rosella]|uniref:Uncharacterized protein n=1 Tax=Mycena rosella TaxID=1033263 RepID=A0AAD7CDT8_MYCRO|nr:hypothetical protein B0H17DRAFT_1148218 [Mycena rosella]